MHPEIKLVCFDLDDTITRGYSWERLNRAMGISLAEDKQMQAWYREGVIHYELWIRLIERLYLTRGNAQLGLIHECLGTWEYMPGAKETIAYLQQKGYEIALVSGAPDVYVDKIARDLGISLAQANCMLVFDSAEMLEQIVTYGDHVKHKLRHLESYCRKLGISISECASIGDGDNDLDLFRATGHGITFKGSPIAKDAWYVVDGLAGLQEIF